MNLIWLPPWSARAITAIVTVLLLLAVIRWWRERRGGALLVFRAIVVIGLLFVMLNPQKLLPREREGKPKLLVLVDSSASMATRDVAGESRFAKAAQALTQSATLATLQREFDLEFREFDRDSRAIAPEDLLRHTPVGENSEIAGALMTGVSDLASAKTQAGILLVSDGRATSPDALEAAQMARARAVPLWTWTLGGPIARQDLWIETASSEALSFSGSEVELTANLRQAGLPNRSFKVEVLKGDTVIETREVLPGTNGTARISARVTAPASGEQRYAFRALPQPEEADTANNERAIFLRSVGEKVRVLIAEGQPHWDTKFLVQALKNSPNVDLTAVYRLNPSRYVAIVSTLGNETRVEMDLFPRTQQVMNSFDIILLGRGAEGFFDDQTESLLTEFVSKRGGSIVFARGKPYGGRFQPLAKLEPLAWGSGSTPTARLKPTDAGKDTPLFDLGPAGTLDELLERLPAMDQVSVTLGEKPLAVVLAAAADQDGPVMVAYQRYGQGKAISLNASGLWRWAFRETGQEESEVAYGRFWVSLLQWLLSGNQFLPGADVSLTSARRYYSSEQPMQFLISTRNLDRGIYAPKITITNGTRSMEVEPRPRGESFVAEAGPFPAGAYQVTLRNNVGQPPELTQTVEVLGSSVEKRELGADPETMRQLAEISGGKILRESDVSRLPELVRQWEIARQLTHRQETAWDKWWVLTGLLALLGVEWWLRRREGLL